MKKILAATVVASVFVGLAGCDNAVFDNAQRKAIRAGLNDPDSAKWGKQFAYKNHACVEVNAKNAFGGYTGKKSAWLTNFGWPKGEYWNVDKVNESLCYEGPLRELSASDDRKHTFEGKLAQVLKTKGLYKVPGDELPIVLPTDKNADKCLKFANDAATDYRIAEDSIGTEKYESWAKKASDGLAALEAGKCE